MHHAALLLWALVGSHPAAAQQAPPDPAPPPTAQVAPDVELAADLRSEYLAGQPMVLTLTATNTGAAVATVPDLSARPWLVKFTLTPTSGKPQVRYSTPPAQDPGTTVTIGVRGQRRTTLEVPSSGALAPGQYQVQVTVDLPAGPVRVADQTVQLRPPAPIAGDVGGQGPDATRRADDVWVHAAGDEFQLYLTQTRSSGRHTWFLTALDGRAQPRLAASRTADANNRHVMWSLGPRDLAVGQLATTGLRGPAVRVQAPWPAIEVLGAPATDGNGRLHAAVWVPAPKGAAGELRVLELGERQVPQFRRAAMLDVRPDGVATLIDEAGTAHFLVWTEAFADVYSLKPGPARAASSLPVAGRRALSIAPPEALHTARYGVLEASDTFAGGHALLSATARQGTVQTRWHSLRGDVLFEHAPVPLPPGAEVIDLLPAGAAAPGLLLRQLDGRLAYVEGGDTAVFAEPTAPWSLARGTQDRPLLRVLDAKEAPVRETYLAITPRPAG